MDIYQKTMVEMVNIFKIQIFNLNGDVILCLRIFNSINIIFKEIQMLKLNKFYIK